MLRKRRKDLERIRSKADVRLRQAVLRFRIVSFPFRFYLLAAFELEQIEALPGTFALRCLG